MKIYADYEKNLTLYDSITRSRKRSIYLYFILGSIFVIFLFFCPKQWYFYATFGTTAAGLYLVTFITWYYIYKYPKKITIFDDLVDDYRDNKIIRELTHSGLKRDDLDCVISPYRYIKIAYRKSDKIYMEYKIEPTRFGYCPTLMPDFVKDYSKTTIVKNFKNYIGKYNNTDYNETMKKKDIYKMIVDTFKNDELIKDLEEDLKRFLENN